MHPALLLIPAILALPLSAAAAPSASILLPPPARLEAYSRDPRGLSEAELWPMRIHGIRMAPLHPLIWAPLRVDRTDNRRLVPIRRFFLRESEIPGFELKQAAITFRFRPVAPRMMEKFPHEKDPVLEMTFGGRYRNPSLKIMPEEDSGCALRLSAFPGVNSGIFRYSLSSYTPLPGTALPLLETGRTYQLRILNDGGDLSIVLDGVKLASAPAGQCAAGLVSLRSSWHPVWLETLEIRGRMQNPANPEKNLSGLVKIRKQNPKGSRK